MYADKNTFCVAPWQHINLDAKGNLKTCCVSGETNHDYKFDQLESYWQSDKVKKLRHNLLNGVKDPICTWCWKEEEAGKISQRKVYNKYLGKLVHTNWDKNFTQNKNLQAMLQNPNTKDITSFDLKLGNLCNLKCIMCSPDQSSKILAEAHMNPELQNFHEREQTKDFEWAESQDFKTWCDNHLPQSFHIKFTGGEPMMNPYLLDILEYIPDEQKQKCILQFTTNLTIINDKILNILEKFKETWFDISVEGVGDVLEYARFGHKWSNLKNNLDTLLNYSSNKKIYVSINHVIQAPTFIGLPNLVNYFDGKKIKIEPLFLHNPASFTLASLKSNIKKDMLKKFVNYEGYNLQFVTAVTKFISQNLDYNENLAKQCVFRLQSFDKVRKNSFHKIIPIDYFL